MKDKLRELAERWKAWREGSDWSIGIRKTCAAELLAILDAEGDGGVVDRDVLAAGVRARNIEITRQQRAGEPNNEDHALRIGIAAALATHSARSGVVSDADDVGILRQAEIDWNDGIDTDASQGELMRLCNAGFLEVEQFRITKKGREAIDAAIQGERHER